MLHVVCTTCVGGWCVESSLHCAVGGGTGTRLVPPRYMHYLRQYIHVLKAPKPSVA